MRPNEKNIANMPRREVQVRAAIRVAVGWVGGKKYVVCMRALIIARVEVLCVRVSAHACAPS